MIEEAGRSAFELKWWPLDIAIAWVLTRDRTFVERQWKRSGSGLTGITVAVAVDEAYGRPLTLEFPGVTEAWTQLKADKITRTGGKKGLAGVSVADNKRYNLAYAGSLEAGPSEFLSVGSIGASAKYLRGGIADEKFF